MKAVSAERPAPPQDRHIIGQSHDLFIVQRLKSLSIDAGMERLHLITMVAKLKESDEREGKLGALGFHTSEITEGYVIAIRALLMESFSTEKIDVINWYLYEYRKGK